MSGNTGLDAVGINPVLDALKGAGETTRLRILAVLREGELTVSELTQVLAQSQPRISRHLKLMVDSGLIERRREGSWAFFRIRRDGFASTLAHFALDAVGRDEPTLERDFERLARIHDQRASAAEAYFHENAPEWDRLRALHAAESSVEAAARAMLVPAKARFERLIDLGTGTGRMLELFADCYESAVGYDANRQMLAFARTRLDTLTLSHADLRQEDILALPEPDAAADAAILHQVLHFLPSPETAIEEAARILAKGGRLLIVDFAPHSVEFLREQHAHRRLGFERAEIEGMGKSAALTPIDYREIGAPPEKGEHGLTVSLWLLQKNGHDTT